MGEDRGKERPWRSIARLDAPRAPEGRIVLVEGPLAAASWAGRVEGGGRGSTWSGAGFGMERIAGMGPWGGRGGRAGGTLGAALGSSQSAWAGRRVEGRRGEGGSRRRWRRT